jgi:ssDNA-binding Zn-finger/Zn-ribbon topoisomerase 1
MDQIIKLYEIGSENLFTRRSIAELFDGINKSKTNKPVIIDFDRIEFVTRSVADEYIKCKQDSKRKVIERNIKPKVRSIIDIVSQKQKEKKDIFRTAEVRQLYL